MPNNKLVDLRNHLFATLEALRDEDKPMDLDRAKTVADVARVIVDSAKVECQFIELTGASGSDFMPAEKTINGTARPLSLAK